MRAEGGRTLGSVENPQPPTRSRPGIEISRPPADNPATAASTIAAMAGSCRATASGTRWSSSFMT
ncbi:hypothetical protein HMPREF3223_01579 [Cutibacterium avidum]|nr:hypothetical protein HMPREF3223_01579 [Cutibacterium avidum]